MQLQIILPLKALVKISDGFIRLKAAPAVLFHNKQRFPQVRVFCPQPPHLTDTLVMAKPTA